MLDCKLCNYYHSVSEESFPGLNLGICDFSDMLFIEDVENMDIEYPCSKIDYYDYLRKQSKVHMDPTAVSKLVNPEMYQDLKKCGVSMLQFPEGMIANCFMDHLEKESAEVSVR